MAKAIGLCFCLILIGLNPWLERAMADVIDVHTIEEWNQNVVQSDKLGVAYFSDTNCQTCASAGLALIRLSLTISVIDKATFVEVVMSEQPSLATQYGVSSAPTFIFVKNGSMVDKVVGDDMVQVEQKTLQYI